MVKIFNQSEWNEGVSHPCLYWLYLDLAWFAFKVTLVLRHTGWQGLRLNMESFILWQNKPKITYQPRVPGSNWNLEGAEAMNVQHLFLFFLEINTVFDAKKLTVAWTLALAELLFLEKLQKWYVFTADNLKDTKNLS